MKGELVGTDPIIDISPPPGEERFTIKRHSPGCPRFWNNPEAANLQVG